MGKKVQKRTTGKKGVAKKAVAATAKYHPTKYLQISRQCKKLYYRTFFFVVDLFFGSSACRFVRWTLYMHGVLICRLMLAAKSFQSSFQNIQVHRLLQEQGGAHERFLRCREASGTESRA